MAGQSAKMGPVLRGEISNTQSRPLNGHPPSYDNDDDDCSEDDYDDNDNDSSSPEIFRI